MGVKEKYNFKQDCISKAEKPSNIDELSNLLSGYERYADSMDRYNHEDNEIAYHCQSIYQLITEVKHFLKSQEEKGVKFV